MIVAFHTHLYAEIFSFAALPWEGVSEVDAMNRMRALEKLEQPDDCPETLYRDVLLVCWRLDVERRASAEQIVASIAAYVSDPANRIPDLATLTWPEMQSAGDELAPVDTFIDLTSKEAVARFQSLELDRSRLDMQKELGKGQFGAVYLASLKADAAGIIAVAVKTMHGTGVPEAEVKQFEYEARLLATLDHPHIIRAIGVCFATAPPLLVLELMGGGDLKKYLKDNQAALIADPKLLSVACVQIADAMAYLESKRVVHRDLAARYVDRCPGLQVHLCVAATCLWAALDWTRSS